MAIKLSTVFIDTSALFYHLLFIHNYHRMTMIFCGFHAVGRNNYMGLDQGVNNCLLLYSNIAVLSFWLSLEVDYFCLII